jgi:galactokinase
MSMPESASASAPGRVNLIGEHTDYHGGFVLPTVIPQRTHVSVLRLSERLIRARSAQVLGRTESYEPGREKPGRGWLDYVQGVTWSLARESIDVPGLEIRVDSTVPLGAGVSSSAALEIGLLRALRNLLRFEFDDITLAHIAQRAETDFVGAPVGIMDQMASSLGRPGEALFIDTGTGAVQRVPVPSTLELIVIHSGIRHAHAGGDYAARRQESFAAAHRLGVARLSDADTTALDRINALPQPFARRARHVVTENARVVAAVAALRDGDGPRLGALFAASHMSMRDDYEISTPEIDALVAIAAEHPAVYGARMTGGGFGGAIVAICTAGQAREAADEISHAYAAATKRHPAVLVPSANQ